MYLSVQITFPAGAESYQRRMRWDLNADGRLDPGEMDSVFNEVQSGFCNFIVTMDKTPLYLHRTKTNSLGLKGHTNSQDEISISLQFEISFTESKGIHTLIIADKPKRGSHCPIQLQAGQRIKLLKYSGRLRSAGSLNQVSYLLDEKHKMVLSFITANPPPD